MIPSRPLSSSSSSPPSRTRERPRRMRPSLRDRRRIRHTSRSSVTRPTLGSRLHAYAYTPLPPGTALSSCAPRRAARNFARRTIGHLSRTASEGEPAPGACALAVASRRVASRRRRRVALRYVGSPLRYVALRCAALRCAASRCGRVASRRRHTRTVSLPHARQCPSTPSRRNAGMRPANAFIPLLSAHPPATTVSRLGCVDS